MRMLLLDTCGDFASLALAEDGAILREYFFAARTVAADIVAVVREELKIAGWPLRSLDSVLVVNGPGSFTGVRVGLAAAKGLCEVSGCALRTLSRLEVLLGASVRKAVIAALNAGRGEYYVRFAASGEERLLSRGELLHAAENLRVVVAEAVVAADLNSLEPELVTFSARDAVRLAVEGTVPNVDVSSVDVNYVRAGQALYASRGERAATPTT